MSGNSVLIGMSGILLFVREFLWSNAVCTVVYLVFTEIIINYFVIGITDCNHLNIEVVSTEYV